MSEQTDKPNIPLHLKPFFEKIEKLAGRVSTVNYKKDLDVKKSIGKKYPELEGIKVTKESIFQVRCGIEYENIKTVKEAHESGDRERKGLPPSMVRVQKGVYYNKDKGVWYVGCGGTQNTNSVRKRTFFVNGEPLSLDDEVIKGVKLSDLLYSKDTSDSSPSEWFQLAVENITKLTGI